MNARPPKEVLVLDMPFGEALERYVGTDMREVRTNVAKSKKKAKKKKKPRSKTKRFR